MAPSPDQALAARYTLLYNRLRLASGIAVGRAWDGLAGLDDAAADRFTQAASVLALSAQSQTAAGVDGYLATMLGAIDGEGSVIGLDADTVSGAAVRAGADPLEVYRRSIVTARVAISNGRAFADAMRQGRDRAISTIETDIALTQRASVVEIASKSERIVGYRRVLTGKSCSLCATASTQRYHSANLMPIHSHCDCGVAPIIGTKDPGQVINKKFVSDLKAAGRASGDPDYWRSRKLEVDADGTVRFPDIAVREHGELGPVLTRAGDSFTGPGDIAA